MLSLEERDEVTQTIETVRRALEDLVVRGTRAAGTDQTRQLEALRDELGRHDAHHLESRLDELAQALRGGDAKAPALLFRAQTSLRVFERVLTLDVARGLLGQIGMPGGDEDEDEDEDEERAGETPAPPRALSRPAPPLGADEKKKLAPVLEELARAVEDLVASGLTAASSATRQKIQVSSTEAARLKLNRLAPALRYVAEEVDRFLQQSPSFSGQRLAFFLNRSWLLLRGIEHALRAEDPKRLGELLWQPPPPVPVKAFKAVVLGVSKRVVQNASSAFDFRLRVVEDAPPLRKGQPLVWSFLRQLEPTFSADALLHLEQAQGFRPRALLAPSILAITQAAVALDERGGGRLVLGPPSKIAVGKEFEDWEPFHAFDPAPALERVAAHRPGPLDLEVELEEEVVLDDYSVGESRPGIRPDQVVYPLLFRGVELDAIVSTQDEGKELRAALDELRKKKKKRPPLFGLMHYELGRIIFRALSALEDEGPRHLMISDEHVNLADLTRAIMSRKT
jgi:hypothetical protein